MPINFSTSYDHAYKALNAGIKIIETGRKLYFQSRYHNKDYIPTYRVDDENAQFSGIRIRAGVCIVVQMERSLNADCHAAANIIRKAVPDIWDRTTDFSFLTSPKVYGF